jgi:quercetin dioxygenase-like cupin family protein
MSRFVRSDVASAIDIQTGAVVSRVIFSDNRIEVTVFGFDAGAGLSEHQASRAAIVQVTKGRLEFIADGEQLDAGPGFWLHMEPGTPHSLTAREPTVMLLTLVDGRRMVPFHAHVSLNRWPRTRPLPPKSITSWVAATSVPGACYG